MCFLKALEGSRFRGRDPLRFIPDPAVGTVFGAPRQGWCAEIILPRSACTEG